ncbi:MAG: SLC13 family permease [Candidatus Freyarchaeota archaeon]
MFKSPLLRSALIYLLLLIGISFLSLFSGLNSTQVVSIIVFSSIILGAILFWRFRLAFGLIGVVILLGLSLTRISNIVESAGFDIILFLIGMMIVVSFLEERRFFEILIHKIVSLVGYNANLLVMVMMMLAALFAALVDEVTSILFVASTMIHLTGKYRINPIPFVIMLVFATNIGSSATVIGNPVGVVVALKANLSFGEFLRWASPISTVSLFAMMLLVLRFFRKDINQLEVNIREQNINNLSHGDKPTVPRSEFLVSVALFLGTILLLGLHNQIEGLLCLPKNTMLLGTSLGAGGVALILDRKKAREIIEKRIDWWTLSFFITFFAAVSTLSVTSVTNILSLKLLSFTGLDMNKIFLSLSLVSGLLSSIIDNVLAISIIIPVIQELGSLGVATFPLWWSILFSSTLFGNLTMIGSTANMVAIGIIERRKLGNINFSQWIKPGLVASVPPLAIALLLLYLQIPLMPWW